MQLGISSKVNPKLTDISMITDAPEQPQEEHPFEVYDFSLEEEKDQVEI